MLGMLLLLSSNDLIILYLSIEILSLSLYVLATIRRTGQFSTEAGLKYFLLGALSSGLLLLGSALIYYITGLTNFNEISYFLSQGDMLSGSDGVLLNGNIISQLGEFSFVEEVLKNTDLLGIQIGVLFIIIAFLFKLAASPFHM